MAFKPTEQSDTDLLVWEKMKDVTGISPKQCGKKNENHELFAMELLKEDSPCYTGTNKKLQKEWSFR